MVKCQACPTAVPCEAYASKTIHPKGSEVTFVSGPLSLEKSKKRKNTLLELVHRTAPTLSVLPLNAYLLIGS